PWPRREERSFRWNIAKRGLPARKPGGDNAPTAREPPMRRNSTARSDALYQRALQVMPGGNTRATIFLKPHPPYAARGEGAWVVDVDEVRRIDFTNNFFSLIHGHAFRPVIEAAREQLERGTCFGLPTESEVELAEEICRRNPAFEHLRFANSG